MSTKKKLQEIYKGAERIPYDETSKFVFMSDCHRGIGSYNDNFLYNQNLFHAAGQHYYKEGYTYIELGDGDELWENRSLNRIIRAHSNSYWLLSKFHKENRLFLVYGNHDRRKEKTKYVTSHYRIFEDEDGDDCTDLFPGIHAHEGMLLEHKEKNQPILLVHGHQGDLVNDGLWHMACFLVRHVWRHMESAGFYDPTSAAQNYKKRKRVEKKLEDFANEEGVMLIAGHTHRPSFSKPKESLYFNDGSCVHPRCITAIEIENGMISLVSWAKMVREDRSIFVERKVLEGPEKIEDYFQL